MRAWFADGPREQKSGHKEGPGIIAPTLAKEKPLGARGRVEVSYLELFPYGLLGEQAIELVPKLRSRAPRSGGGPGVCIALAISQTDAHHRILPRLD